jgi:hypothetical protein
VSRVAEWSVSLGELYVGFSGVEAYVWGECEWATI